MLNAFCYYTNRLKMPRGRVLSLCFYLLFTFYLFIAPTSPTHQLDMAVLQVTKFQVLVGGGGVCKQFCFSLGGTDILTSMTALSEAQPGP